MKLKDYLPPFLQDFHDAKEFFAMFQEWVESGQDKLGVQDYERLKNTSRHNHVFVVDYFLWYMAQAGYTLQKTKKKGLKRFEIEDDLTEYRKEVEVARNQFFGLFSEQPKDKEK